MANNLFKKNCEQFYYSTYKSLENVLKKDINQIKELYGNFLSNYTKLNKIFDLNNPIEIYTMFNYLLYKGYLSENKKFEFSGKQTSDIRGLLGIEIITGRGVCRHISGMLTDILNEYGIESSQLAVYQKFYRINVVLLEHPKYTKEELIDWVKMHVVDKKTSESLINLIDELIDKKNQSIEIFSKMIDDNNVLKRKFGNHVISFAFKDNKSYFLDPTQTRIYRMNKYYNLYDCRYEDTQIHLKSSILLNDLKRYLQLKKNLSMPYITITPEEEQTLVQETLIKCKNNMDVFEHFYNNNCELYDNILGKMLCLKTNKIF